MNGVDVKLIQMVRNPYDPISLMMIRGGRSFENAINHYFDYCETLSVLRRQLNGSTLLTIRYEEFLTNPKSHLAAACSYLGIEADEDYLDACAAILYESPERDRDAICWDAKWIGAVQEKIDQVDFLAGYSFDF